MRLLLLPFLIITMISCTFEAFAIGGGPQPMGLIKNETPANITGVGITENLGEKIDLTLEFTDEYGEKVKLQDYFSKGKPVFLVMVYYECPTLCSTQLTTTFETFKNFEWKIGEEWEFIAVSIDPKENDVVAKKKKDLLVELYGKEGSEDGIHLLTGEEKNIKALASQVGFGYRKENMGDQWLHAAAAYVLTPDGAISYYHYGLTVVPQALRLSLVEASENKIGTVMDKVILFCMQYDPNKKTYAFYAYNLMRVGGVVTLLVLGIFLTLFWRKQRSTENSK